MYQILHNKIKIIFKKYIYSYIYIQKIFINKCYEKKNKFLHTLSKIINTNKQINP